MVPALEPKPPEAMTTLYLAVLDQNVQLRIIVQNQREEISDLYQAKESAEADFKKELDEKVLMKVKATEYKNEADELRKELGEKDQKIAWMSYIHETAHKDFKLKIADYSIELGQNRHTISRDIVSILVNEMHEDAVMHY